MAYAKGDPRQAAATRRYYLKNKPDYYARNTAKRHRMRAWLSATKDNQPCSDCGLTFPGYVLDYDHKDWMDKSEIVSRLVSNLSWKKLFEEIAKCDLVCANCHRIRTHNRKQTEPNNFEKRDARDAKIVQSPAPTLH